METLASPLICPSNLYFNGKRRLYLNPHFLPRQFFILDPAELQLAASCTASTSQSFAFSLCNRIYYQLAIIMMSGSFTAPEVVLDEESKHVKVTFKFPYHAVSEDAVTKLCALVDEKYDGENTPCRFFQMIKEQLGCIKNICKQLERKQVELSATTALQLLQMPTMFENEVMSFEQIMNSLYIVANNHVCGIKETVDASHTTNANQLPVLQPSILTKIVNDIILSTHHCKGVDVDKVAEEVADIKVSEAATTKVE